MKTIIKIAVFFAVFVLVFIWKFPYDALVENALRRAEVATNATITYQPVSAGPLGVRVSDLHIHMPSGASIRFDSAKLFATTSGARLTALQGENEMKATLSPTTLHLDLKEISVDTGSSGIGQARATGDLEFELASREGKGTLRLVIPELKLPIPVDPAMEVGAAYTIRQVGAANRPRSAVSAEVNLMNKDITANGTVSLEGQPGPGRPIINGNLNYEHSLGRGTLQLGGTWDNPSIKTIPK